MEIERKQQHHDHTEESPAKVQMRPPPPGTVKPKRCWPHPRARLWSVSNLRHSHSDGARRRRPSGRELGAGSAAGAKQQQQQQQRRQQQRQLKSSSPPMTTCRTNGSNDQGTSLVERPEAPPTRMTINIDLLDDARAAINGDCATNFKLDGRERGAPRTERESGETASEGQQQQQQLEPFLWAKTQI